MTRKNNHHYAILENGESVPMRQLEGIELTDVEPVLERLDFRKARCAQWKTIYDEWESGQRTIRGFDCSNCGKGILDDGGTWVKKEFNYCPFCGAKMEQGETE